MMTDTPVTTCGHEPSPHSSITNGVAHTPDGRVLCYDCSDSEQAAQVSTSRPGDTMTLYVSSDGKSITTWPGGVLMRVTKWGKQHPLSRQSWGGPRNYLQATDHLGRIWSGTGASGTWASLRLTKGQVA